MPAATRRRKSAGRRPPRTARKPEKTPAATKKASRKRKEKKLSRVRKPDEMSLEDWQRVLRRQFGREQGFQLENVGDDTIFSEFRVTNPESGSTYRVAIRGSELGVNFCSCPDFQTNALGTCKHVEFTLNKLERKRGGKKAFREGFHPAYSEIYVQYGAQRQVRFHAGDECPRELARLIGRYFNDERSLKDSAVPRFQKLLSPSFRKSITT
jgi:ribosomal protein RSM22 (predicted rRNA methylase)